MNQLELAARFQSSASRQRWLDESQLDDALTRGRNQELKAHPGHAQQDVQDPGDDECPTTNQVSSPHIEGEGVLPSRMLPMKTNDAHDAADNDDERQSETQWTEVVV